MAVFDVIDLNDVKADLNFAFPKNTVLFHNVDVRNKNEIEIAFQKATKEFGYVDVLVNCVGIADESNIDEVINVNLVSQKIVKKKLFVLMED